jgi:hypothetical protein
MAKGKINKFFFKLLFPGFYEELCEKTKKVKLLNEELNKLKILNKTKIKYKR